MRVAVLANLKTNAPHWEGMPTDQWDDLDSEKSTNSIVQALESAGPIVPGPRFGSRDRQTSSVGQLSSGHLGSFPGQATTPS